MKIETIGSWGRIALVALVFGACTPIPRNMPPLARQQYLMMGKRFRTKMDLVVFRPNNENEIYLAEMGYENIVPREDQMKPSFPFTYLDLEILGVLPSGSVFAIGQVAMDQNKNQTAVMYTARILSTSNPLFLNLIVECDTLQLIEPNSIRLNPKYVDEI